MPNDGRINFQVNMDVKKNGLKDLIEPLKQVQSKMNSISSNSNLDEPFKEAASAAKQLESIINSSWNDKLNQLNLNQFNQSIKTSFKDVESLKNILTQAGPEGQAAFNQVASAVLNTNVQLRESNKLLDSMATSMANTVKWGITSSIFNNITSSIQHAYYYAKDLDSSLNDIRIVTGDSADQMQRFAKTANNAAKDLGRSTLDYTKAALSFYQQGLSDDEVKARTEVSLKAQNITGAGSQMYDQLTAVWNGFKVATEDTESVVDKLAAVADNSASNMSQLATAMSKVAATANVMGVDVDQLTAQISTVVAATRLAPESVGTAFKTIYSRLNDIKTGADEAQISLGNYSGKMAELGFNVLDSAGNLRDTGQVIEQIGGRWQTLTRQQQVYLAQTMGGQRQITQVMALFDNWDRYLNNLNVSMSSQGTLMEKNNTYLESTQAHLQQLGTQAERTYDILFDQDTVNGFVDGLEGVLKIFNDFINGLGGGTKAFAFFGTTVANIFSKQISDAILKVKDDFDRIQVNKATEQLKNNVANSILDQRISKGQYDSSNQQAATEAAKRQAQLYQQILSVKQGLTQESYNELTALQQQIGVSTQKIQMIENYQSLMDQVVGFENSSQQDVLEVIKERQESLENQKNIYSEVLNEVQQYVDTVKQGHVGYVQNQQALQRIEQLTKSTVLSEEEKAKASQIYNALINNQVLTDEDIKFIHQTINKELVEKKRLLEEANQAYDMSKRYAQGQADALKQQREASQRVFKIGIDRAKQSQKLQNNVRNITAGLSSATALLSSITAFTKEGATAAEKANAAFAGVQGTLPGIASIIANSIVPGTGLIASSITTGIIALGKGILEITGLWDGLENRFRSTQEKIDNLNNTLKNGLDKALEPLKKKQSLQGLKEEFDSLVGEAESYGDVVQSLNDEQLNRYHQILNQIAEINPDIVDAYDAQHNAIIENNKALDITIEKLQKEYQAQQALVYSEGNINSELSLLSDVRQDKEKAQNRYNKRQETLDKMALGQETEEDFYKFLQSGNYYSSGPGSVDIEKFLIQALGVTKDAQGNFIAPDRNSASQAFFSLFDLKGLSDQVKTEMQVQISNFVDQVTEGIDQNGSIAQNILAEKYLELDKNLSEIVTSGYLNKIQGDIDNLTQQQQTILNQFTDHLTQAFMVTPEYDRVYQKYKKSLGESFQQSGFQNLMQEAIQKEITDFLKSDLTGIDEQDYDNLILIEVNKSLENIFNKISPQQLTDVNDQLENLLSQTLNPLEYKKRLLGIINNFIEKTNLTDSLKDVKTRDDTLDILKLLFPIDDLSVDKDGVITNYLDKTEAIKNQIYDKTFSLLSDQEQLSSYSSQDSFIAEFFKDKSAQDLAAFNQYYQGLEEQIRLEDLPKIIEDFFNKKEIDDITNDTQQNLIENFDKVTSIIDKLQKDKSLKQSQKDWLKEKLHLTDEELYGLDANVTTLQAIIEKILNLTDQGQKYTGLDAIFGKKGGLKTFYETSQNGLFTQKGKGLIPSNISQDNVGNNYLINPDAIYAYKKALEAQQEAIQMNDNELLTYGKIIGEVTEGVTKLTDKQKEAIITYYNNQQALESLSSQAKALADAEKITNEDLAKFTTELNEQFDTNFSAEWVRQHIDGIASALAIGIDPSKLEQYAENYVPPIASKFSEEFDKVTSIINTIQNSENLSHADKEWLKQALGITDQELQQLDTNEKLLQEIAEKILTITDPDKRANAFGLIYKDLDSYYKDVANNVFEIEGIPTSVSNQRQQEAHQAALENSMAAYGVSAKYLRQYGDQLGYAGKSLEQLFRIYQKEADSKSLQLMGENLAKNKDELSRTSEEVFNFRDKLNEMFGTDYDSSFIIQNIDAIVDALNRGITNAQGLKLAIANFKPPEESSFDQYQNQKDLTENAGAAKKSLQSGTALSDDQAAALAQLEATHAELAALGAEGNRNSAEYLNLLQQILSDEQTLTEEKRNQALTESQDILTTLQQEKEKYDSLVERFPDSDYFKQKQLETDKAINEQLAQQIQLQQQLNQEQAEIPQRKLDDDVNKDNWEDLTKYLQDYGTQLEGVSQDVERYSQAAEDLAQSILRFDSALESVQKNYEDWEQMLTSGSIQDAAQAGAELQDVYSDLLDLPFENLSPDFTQDIDNLHLLQQAANGSEQAYEQLRQAAMQDILAQVGLDDTNFQSTFNTLQSQINNGIDDLQIGAYVDDTQAIQAMNQLINAAEMTADQATDLLASMGVDAEVEQVSVPEKQQQGFINAVPHVMQEPVSVPTIIQPTDGDTQFGQKTVWFPRIYYTGEPDSSTAEGQKTTTALRVKSAKKSSGGGFKFNQSSHGGGSKSPKSSGGGGGGGGGKPKKGGGGGSGTAAKPKTQKAVKGKSDRYHDINIDLKHINDQLQKLQENEKKLANKDLVKNLEAQLKVLNKQRDAYEAKLELERQERDQLQATLKKQGAKFDPNGDISNYATLTSTALSDLNKEIAKYNAMTAEQQQKYQTTLDAAKERYDTLLENIKRYDDIVSSEIPELQKQIRSIRDQVIEKQIQKFKIKVDLQLDLSQAERDFNEFRKKVIDKIKDDDILGNTKALLKDFSSYYKKGGKGVITGLTNQVNDTLEQLYSIDRTGTSSVYGDNRAAALKDLQEYTNKLMENLEDVEDLVDDIKESIFDAIDKAQDAFDEQVNEYQFISKIIDHDVKMVKLLYGDDAYESMNKYHSQQQENNNKQLDFLKRQKDYWAGQMAAEQARMNNLDPGTAAFKEAQKRFEEYKKHWMSSVEDLNSKLEDSLENVIDKYANAIDLTFDKLNKKLTDGKGLEYVNEEWQLINKKSDMYLDKINSMYEIDKLENAYQDLLKDNEGNLAAQRSIKDMMKEQMAYLRDKDKLTQYDVDRANALLQIEVKRLALEQQRQSKTKLRLRRDSQGNYTYQYTADQESLDNAEQELRDAENSLYNMTRQAYKNNLKDFYDTYSDWQDRIKEVAKDTTLTVEEQQQKMAMLNQYYGDMINGYVEENANLQKFLMQDAFDELSTMYGTDVKDYESMIQEEKQALMGDLVPQWDSSVQDMINIFAGEKDGKKGFLPTVQDAFTGIDTATKQYEASLDTLQQVAGVSFQDIADGMDATSVEAQKLLNNNITLINAYGAEVNAVQGVINKVGEMQTAYGLAEASAIAAAQAASKYIQKEGDLNKTAAAAQAAKSAVEAAAAARAAANNSNPSSPSSGGGGGNTGSGSGGSGGSGGGSGTGSGNGSGTVSNSKSITKTPYKKYNGGKGKTAMYMATGGYTGAWGDEGRIAVLHEKQLVLNKEDTANMLQAVSIVRTMNDLLSNMNNSTDFINTIGFGSGNNSQTLEQNVHIEASFPNVTDHSEIEQALNNLVNRASQFAFKN